VPGYSEAVVAVMEQWALMMLESAAENWWAPRVMVVVLMGSGALRAVGLVLPRSLLRTQRFAPSHPFGIKSRGVRGLPALLDYLSGVFAV